jgi:protein-L-isoaspartate O-methyltransferase
MTAITKTFFDAYGEALAHIGSPRVAAGRYYFQDERHILRDVTGKLHPEPEHRLLEVGFGSGLLLLPLARMVREAVGVDHPSAVERLDTPNNVSLVAGRWPDVTVDGRFDRILAYSVLQYVTDHGEADRFIDACLDQLADGGILMLGDLPNHDAARRFKRTQAGRDFMDAWADRIDDNWDEEMTARDRIFAAVDHDTFTDDDFIVVTVARYRRQGFDAYALPQPDGLPFFPGREDVIIRRPPA